MYGFVFSRVQESPRRRVLARRQPCRHIGQSAPPAVGWHPASAIVHAHVPVLTDPETVIPSLCHTVQYTPSVQRAGSLRVSAGAAAARMVACAAARRTLPVLVLLMCAEIMLVSASTEQNCAQQRPSAPTQLRLRGDGVRGLRADWRGPSNSACWNSFNRE